jgi:SAM-dependent methyltransferase
VKDRHADDWEELAQREPYFAVLTDEGFLGVEGNSVATAGFFETGEEDIAALMQAIASLSGRELHPAVTLDFGCGVGRLTIPLARRSERVVGCDVAPTMLAHARENAERAGVHNVELIVTDALSTRRDGEFDFVCSLLVFQHIPPRIGHELIRTILRLLAQGGVAALHVTFDRPGGQLRRMARSLRSRSRLAHRLAGLARGNMVDLPYMQMNQYDERVLAHDVAAAGARITGRFPTRHGDTSGAVLVIEKMAP